MTSHPIQVSGTVADGGLRWLWDLVTMLAHRDVASRYRNTLLGWSWPIVRQLAQLGILVFVFSVALDLDIEDYPLFVFVGLVFWSWFSTGVEEASSSLIRNRHLVFRPGFPTVSLPLVSIAVRFIDVLLVLPFLATVVLAEGDLSPAALLFIPLLFLQLALMAGFGFLVASISAYLRDVPSLVGVVMLMLFYVTPVFFDISRIPDQYQWILRLNPIAVLIEAYRDVLIDGQIPGFGGIAFVLVLAIALCGVGLLTFRRLSGNFVDVL